MFYKNFNIGVYNMIKNICKDEKFLSIVSVDANIDDLWIGNDLLDTIKFHHNGCVGMAANMIGISKRILVFEDTDKIYSWKVHRDKNYCIDEETATFRENII